MSKGPLTAMPNTQKAKVDSAEAPGKTSIAELKNGKVLFRQKPHSFEKHSETLQELVKFREMLQERISNNSPALTGIDDEHKPLIAKLVHESDKTLSALSKHVRSQLIPSDDDDSDDTAASGALLPVSIIETAIQEVAQRNNYGIETDLGTKAPASVCVWRWEVREPHRRWLPKSAQDKAASRLDERIKAKNELASTFAALPEEEQRTILHTKSNGKSQKEDRAKVAGPSQGPESASGSSGSGEIQKADGEENAAPAQTKSKVGRPKKDEKAAKGKKEKDAQKSLMTNFFTKPKASVKSAAAKDYSATAGPSTIRSDFEKTFKPFVLKKGAQLAPINAFLECKAKTSLPNGTRDDVIVVDDDDDEHPPSAFTDDDVAHMSAKERLGHILSSLPPPAAGPMKRPPKSSARGMKTYYPVSVRDLLQKLSEVEMFGDATLVRAIHNQLADRALLPAKVFIFHEDARPGYYGTWTRSSPLIGARSPFAKAVLDIDYGYDSGEDWEEEPSGDADDVMDDGEDDELGTEDRDSDIDDWLVDDDEVEEGVPIHSRSVSPSVPRLPSLPKPKRKAEDADSKSTKKRKLVVPLVPFAKGPCWETSIGDFDAALRPYQIRLLNDTPFPIDPFTFVSSVDNRRPVKAPEGGFAVPALPNHCLPGTKKPAGATTSATAATTLPAAPKKSAPAPKTAFPDEHLPVLLSKINTVQAANLTVLVEAVSQELREHKVKKNAIEAKIREVGEKCKVRKFWVVKENEPATAMTQPSQIQA